MSKAGFVSIIGRPNAGKSSLLNAIIKKHIALVSHKINATRKRINVIAMHNDSQIIFTDTPGIQNKKKMLNQFMLQESIKAINDCDLAVFIASCKDSIEGYASFLNINKGKKHLLILSKIDMLTNVQLLSKISEYSRFQDRYLSLIPISSKKNINISLFLDEVEKYIPESIYFYDTDLITSENTREIYKEKIMESMFNYLDQEIPYQSDVIIDKIIEGDRIDKIYATIIVEKHSQKIIVIGKNGETIKNIGISSRNMIEKIAEKQVFIALNVVVHKGWSKNKDRLKEIGYRIN